MFALDTNTLVYFFKGAGHVARRLLSEPPSEIAVPAVVVYELEVGISQSSRPAKRRAQLDEFLAVTTVLPFDGRAARAAAELRAELENAGTSIGPMDTLIAGTALAQGATLVTHNTREFRRIRRLKVVDWY